MIEQGKTVLYMTVCVFTISELSNSCASEHADLRVLPDPPFGLDDSLAHPPPG